MPEDIEKQNSDEPCSDKYQKYISCSYGYKLVCVDDKFCTPFNTHLHEDKVYNFINMIKKGKYSSEVIKNIITKNL